MGWWHGTYFSIARNLWKFKKRISGKSLCAGHQPQQRPSGKVDVVILGKGGLYDFTRNTGTGPQLAREICS